MERLLGGATGDAELNRPLLGGAVETEAVDLLARQTDLTPFLTASHQFRENWVGVLVPIEVTFQANNTNALEFLFHLSHCERGYDLHSIRLQINEGQQSNMLAVTTVVLGYAWINNFSTTSGGATAASGEQGTSPTLEQATP
jgi:hypothetical protein